MKQFIKGQVVINKALAESIQPRFGEEYYQSYIPASPHLRPEEYQVVQPFNSGFRNFKGAMSSYDYHNKIQTISESKLQRCVVGGQEMDVYISRKFGVVNGMLNRARTHFYFMVDRFGMGYEVYKAKVWIDGDGHVLGANLLNGTTPFYGEWKLCSKKLSRTHQFEAGTYE